MSRWRFSPQPMTDPHLFYGRERIVGEIRDLMTAGPSAEFVFVHGGQKIGRTSLLKQLHAQSEALLGPLTRACFVDLRLWTMMSQGAITANLAQQLLGTLSGQPPPAAGYEVGSLLTEMMAAQQRQPERLVVLLIDRGDELLDAGLRQKVATLLGMLNDGLPNLGIVLSFGTGEELGSTHVLRRMEQVDDAVREISPVWGRVTTRLLCGLPRSESLRFLDAAGCLTQSEIDWIIDLAGDHPLLLNRVGLALSREKQEEPSRAPDARRRMEIEDQLVRDLLPMSEAILQRLASDAQGEGVADIACQIAADPPAEPRSLASGGPDVQTVGILAGEGLIQVEDAGGDPLVLLPQAHEAADVRYWMPSRLLRRSILEVREARRAHRQAHVRRTPTARERAATVEVVVREDPRTIATVRLTDKEERVMQRLLEAPGEVLGADDLAAEVWGSRPEAVSPEQWQERLRQLMLRLRRKLARYVGGESIVNDYGRGYRLVTPERFAIRS